MTDQSPLTRQPNNDSSPRPFLSNLVMSRSRFARMGFVFVGAMALAMLLLPVVDQLFFSIGGVYMGQSSAPSWIVLIFCFGLYFSGYVFVIGTPGFEPDDSRPQRLYITTVFAIILLTVIWYTITLLSASGGV